MRSLQMQMVNSYINGYTDKLIIKPSVIDGKPTPITLDQSLFDSYQKLMQRGDYNPHTTYLKQKHANNSIQSQAQQELQALTSSEY